MKILCPHIYTLFSTNSQIYVYIYAHECVRLQIDRMSGNTGCISVVLLQLLTPVNKSEISKRETSRFCNFHPCQMPTYKF